MALDHDKQDPNILERVRQELGFQSSSHQNTKKIYTPIF